MAALVTGNLEPGTLLSSQNSNVQPGHLTSTVLLGVVEACLHRSASEWISLRELRVGTGVRTNAAQRLDAYALNCLPHTSMRLVCYEVEDFASRFRMRDQAAVETPDWTALLKRILFRDPCWLIGYV